MNYILAGIALYLAAGISMAIWAWYSGGLSRYPYHNAARATIIVYIIAGPLMLFIVGLAFIIMAVDWLIRKALFLK